MLVCLLLGLTAPLTGFIAYALPSLFVSAINLLAQGVNGVVKAFGVLNVDGVIDLGKSIVFIFAGFYLVISKPSQVQISLQQSLVYLQISDLT